MSVGTAVVAVAAVAACKAQDPQVAPPPAVAPGPAATFDAMPATVPATVPATAIDARPAATERPDDAMLASDALVAGDVASPPADLVVEAFRGHPPALPMLSADGKLAAIDLSQGLGLSSFSSYEVGFLDPTGAVRERITVVDHALAAALAVDGNRAEGTPPMTIPRQRLAKVAATITRRLATFTPFAKAVDFDAIERAAGKLALGGATLTFHADETTGLALRLTGASAAAVRSERVPVRPRQFTDRDGGRCGGQPKLIGVWWDPARHRALLQITFPGHDSCEDESLLWLFW
jgi:hypothetical protein